ncbi:MAG: hypothetical protein IT564_07410 [Rhodospirillales bacterium]|nr:hypothetical protein [Rhodospirillales bacterium]
MSPLRLLSFSPEAFFSVFEHYNRAVWPAPVAAYGLGLAALALVFRPVPSGGRWVAAILAAMWAWNGIAYHLIHFAEINFVAPVFAAFFVLQALLFAWTGALKGKIAFRFRPDPAGWTGAGLMVFAMAVYPLLGWLAGHGGLSAAVFGIAPCPTTIFTLGALLLIEGRAPWRLAAIPLAWSLVGGSAVWLLGVPEDLALPLAGLAAFGLALRKTRR